MMGWTEKDATGTEDGVGQGWDKRLGRRAVGEDRIREDRINAETLCAPSTFLSTVLG